MPSEKSIGTYQHDNSRDAQKFIQQTIQNDGAFIPSGLNMIQSLRKVTNGQNPTAIESVGLGNFTQALSALSSLFGSSGGGKSNSSNTANVNPCSIPVEQRTEQEQYDCDVLTAIANAEIQMANSVPTS
jgi:hypothetical protein